MSTTRETWVIVNFEPFALHDKNMGTRMAVQEQAMDAINGNKYFPSYTAAAEAAIQLIEREIGRMSIQQSVLQAKARSLL